MTTMALIMSALIGLPQDPVLPVGGSAPPPQRASYPTRAPSGHTHTCAFCGTTWDHKENPTHNCRGLITLRDGSTKVCGAQQLQIDQPSRRVTILPKERLSLKANPFHQELVALLEGSDKAAGPWPESMSFPEDMTSYKPATMTQKIYTVQGDPRDHIDPVPRSALDNKDWMQSGGMRGVKDFRSDLYRYFPKEPETWIGDIAVKNGGRVTVSDGYRTWDGGEATQNNRGYQVLYADGTRFMDVLSTKGTVFEIRQREKVDGKWNSSVLYEDVPARPVGYTGLKVSCASCHKQAGTGGYAVGLVPGGDGVLSVGFKALEKP